VPQRWLVAAAAAAGIAGAAGAQPFERPAQERPELPGFETRERPEIELPALPEPGPAAAPGPRIRVRAFEVEGSSVFGEAELAPILAPWVGRELSTEDLLEIRDAITRLYEERGYAGSRARIPDQDPQDGVIRIQVVEGRLARIEVQGARWYRPGRLASRVALGAETPLDVAKLEEALQLLQQDPRIERVAARLRAGEAPGDSILELAVEERPPWRVEVEADNYANPLFGGYQGELVAADENLVGLGDSLGGRFRGAGGLLDFDGSYAIPLTARGTRLELGGEWSDSEIVEDPFSELEIETRYESARIRLEQPVYRTLRTRAALGLSAEWRRARTRFCAFEDLLGGCDPFAFPGSGADPDDGRTTVSVLRLSQEIAHRDRNQVLAARSLLSIGLPILGASGDDVSPVPLGIGRIRNPDSEFVAWLAQLQWVRRFEPSGLQAIARVDAQLASDALPSLERFPLGGHLSVRGYRENQIVRDQGVVASLELRIPLLPLDGRAGLFQLAPFADFGHATNRRNPTPDPENLASVGVGVLWAFGPVDAEIYWGHQIVDVDTSGDLQDHGIQFRVRLRVF
jgi:hemolysin activation/secretion protein